MDKHKSANKKKTTAGIAAVVLILALLLTGTFAWYSTTSALNKFVGGDEYEVVLHDDYDGDGNDTHVKRVYAENVREEPVYVRIRLDEYLEYDGVQTIAAADRIDVDTWETHIPTALEEVCLCGAEFHDYWEWIMGDDNGYAYRPSVSRGMGGTWTDYRYDENNQYQDTWDPSDIIAVTPDCEVITIEEYMDKYYGTGSGFAGWVIDTNGWAYWTQELEQGDVTGTLLNQVNRLKRPGETYYYGINVVMEAVTYTDLKAWAQGLSTTTGEFVDVASPDGARMLWEISGTQVRGLEIQITDKISEILASNGGSLETGGILAGADGSYQEMRIGTIDWLLLDYDPDTKLVTLISRDMLETRAYHGSTTAELYPTWEKSQIRSYLRDEFFYNAIDPELQALAYRTQIQTETAYNDQTLIDTEDYIYLLDNYELARYWPTVKHTQRIAKHTMKDYWRLRSPSTADPANVSKNCAGSVFKTGEVIGRYVYHDEGVRPVIKLNLR